MATIDQKQKFAGDLIAGSTQMIYAFNALDDLLTRYFDLGLSGQLANEDFAGHGGLTHVDSEAIVAAVSTVEALKTLMEAGHRANLNRIIR